MTAITDTTKIENRSIEDSPTNYEVGTVGVNKIYKDSLVGIDETDRLMYPWGTAGKTLEFVGFSYSTYEAGSDPAYSVKQGWNIRAYEGVALAVAGVVAITDEGSLLYCSTDNWTEDLTLVAGGDPIGRISKFVSAGHAECEFFTFTNAIVSADLAVGGDLDVAGDTALHGLLESDLGATEYWQIDADTVDHTGAYVFNMDVGINSASVNAFQINLDVGTALTGVEVGKAIYIDLNALAADANGTALLAFDTLITAISTSRADLFGFRGTFDGTQDGADTTTGLSIIDTQTQNTSTFKGILVDGTGYTHTAGDWYGFDIQNTVVTTAGNAYGGRILVDMTDNNNAKTGLVISKDLASTAGATTQSNSALTVESVNANTHASIMTISNVLASYAETNSAAAAGADVYSGNMINLAYSATTAIAGTATSNKTALNVDYNVTETAGTLSLTSFSIANIDYDTVGTVSYANGTYNLLNINATDAAIPTYAATGTFNGVNVDVSGMDVTDADLVQTGIRLTMPATYGGATTSAFVGTGNGNTIAGLRTALGFYASMVENAAMGISIECDADNLDNTKRVLYGSRDLTGAISANRNVNLFAATLYQNVVNSSIGDFEVTDTAATSGVLNLISAHTVSAGTAKTTADEFLGTVFSINNSVITGADAFALLDNTSRAINILYDVTAGAASTLNYNATDIIKVDWNVNAGTVINGAAAAGAYITGMTIDANGFIPGATLGATTIITGHLVDFTDVAINDANLSLYGYKAIMPQSADNTTNAISSAFMAVLSTDEGIGSEHVGYTAWDIHTNTAVATDTTSTMLANFVSELTSNQGGGAAVITRATNPVIDMDITLTSTGAADIVNMTSGFINMAITAAGAGTNVLYGNMVSLTIAGTNNAAQALNGYYLNADDITLNNAAASFAMIRLDASGLTNTDSASSYGLNILASAGLDYAIYSEGWNKFTYVDQSAYYWCEDWDEEAAAVTRAAGLRADEWTEGGTTSGAALYTYIQAPGGVLNLTTAATNDDSTWMLGLTTKFNTTNNPVFEGRIKATTLTTKMFYAGVTTAGVDDLAAAYAFANNTIAIFVDSDNTHGFGAAHVVIAGKTAAGAVETFDSGLTAVLNTYITYRIDLADVATPLIYINVTGGAITPADLITVGWARGIDTAVYVAPFAGVQALDAVAAPIQVDYFKAWQDRA